jgi:hypothetical protein
LFFQRSPSIAEFEAEQNAVPDNGIAVERRALRHWARAPESGNPW